jgi:hypothetical protein
MQRKKGKTMKNDQTHVLQRPLRTPRAAAIAGILFAVLQIAIIVIFQVSIPANSFDQTDWLREQSRNITLALGLLPFAGIAFLWFMGVVRDRMGHLEDQFFSTLFFGSGLLYLAMTFATAAVAGGLITIYAVDPDMFIMPRWLVISTYLIAFALLIGISFYPWTTLFFPAWVFVISTYILVLNYRYEHKDGITLER